MADEITVPLLPCRDIDEIVEFYGMLGFSKTYYQQLPNPMVALKREDINLQFFGMPEEFKPEDSYGSCLVIVRDTWELYRAFADGMRAAHGKLLVSGIPRMTRPRKRKNADNHSGFSVIDPGGNWIRVMAAKPEPDATDAVQGRLAKSLHSAVVMGDSHGFDARAAQILDAALARRGTRHRRPTCSRHSHTEPSSPSAWTTPQEPMAPSSERGRSSCPMVSETRSPRPWPASTTWRLQSESGREVIAASGCD